MDYLPICLDLRGQPCVVIGGGEVALRKAALLRDAGARLSVIAPELCAGLAELLAAAQDATHRARAYAPGDLAGARLVIAATSLAGVNAAVAAEARELGVPVNVVDAPALCTAIMPAIVDRSPVLIAITTGGASPVLARTARAVIERALPERLGELARWARRHRAWVQAQVADADARRALWESLIEGDAGRHVLAGRIAEADALLADALRERAVPARELAIVIAPADDVERLTLGALRRLGRCSRVLATPAVSEDVLGYARRDAARERLHSEALADLAALAARMTRDAARGGHACLVITEVEAARASLEGLIARLRAERFAVTVHTLGPRA